MSEQKPYCDESPNRKMLFEILLEEYQELGIFTFNDVTEIKVEWFKARKTDKILLYEEAENHPDPKIRQIQFDLRQVSRFKILKLIRERLHKVGVEKINEVYEKYQKLFSKPFWDKEIEQVAIHLATLKELNEGVKTETEGEILTIYECATELVKENKNNKSEQVEKSKLDEKAEELNKYWQNRSAGSPAAICFSGGGIRSATFGLGVLQSLAKRGLLGKFTYLSSVSGGGYISSWLSAWIHRKGLEKVQNNLAGSDLKPDEVEAPEVTHLRSYSNYMSPTLGLLSADTWTLIAVYLRNLLLNWTVIIPLIAAFLLLPKLFVSLLSLDPKGEYQFLLYSAIWILAAWAGIVAIHNTNLMRPSLKRYSSVDQKYKVDDIGKSKTVEGKIFRWIIIWVFFMAIGMTIFWYWDKGVSHLPTTIWIAGVTGTKMLRLIDFMQFGAMIFLSGYFLSWLLMLRKFWNNKSAPPANETGWKRFKRVVKTYLSEPIALFFCGSIGGGLLYLVVQKVISQFPLVVAPKIILAVKPIVEESLTKQNELAMQSDLAVWYACFGVPIFLAVFLLTATIFTGAAVRFTEDEDREWMARFGAWILIIIFGWTVISSAVLFGPNLFEYIINESDWIGKTLLATVGGVSGIVSLVLGFSSKTPANDEDDSGGTMAAILKFAPTIGAPIFLLFLICLVSYLTDLLTYHADIYENYNQIIWFFILMAVGLVMSWFININKFSFHSTYRERLIRAYLGASRTKERMKEANSFIGLDTENDNVVMAKMKGQAPFHVVNMTLNLVKPNNLRWQNRKAESFTATPLHCGSSNMGAGSGNYRKSEEYAYNPQNGKAMTLGTAAAVSGAAASPNMGYFSMGTAVAFLMVLLNVRLGWWLGNPGKRGDDTYKLPAPIWSHETFFTEAFGLTDDNGEFVYLSDGGHFENLGIYEMVLRRCKTIVVCDGGADPDFTFFDLGAAIHKIRVDMGIPIKFEINPAEGRNCAIATIHYKLADGETAENGKLIYIKPTLDANQPIDIVQYQSVNKAFPHEGTLDQFYSETQFESYRKLGFNMMESICRGNKTRQAEANKKLDSIPALLARADEYLNKMVEQEKKPKKETDKKTKDD